MCGRLMLMTVCVVLGPALSVTVDPDIALSNRLLALEAELQAIRGTLGQLTTPYVLTVKHGASRNYTQGEIIQFQDTLVDLGGMYNRRTGVVSIPQDGVYTISVRADPAGDVDAYSGLTLNVNSQAMAAAYGEHGSMASLTLALRLHRGDNLWVSQTHGRSLEYSALLSVVRVWL